MRLDKKQRDICELVAKISAVLAIIMFFVPICKFELLGASVSFSPSTFTFGKEMNGYEVIEGKFGCIFMLIIPMAIAAIMQFIRSNNVVKYGGSIVLAIIDVIILASAKKEITEQGYGLIDTTFGYVFDFIILAVIIISCIMLLLSKEDELSGDVKNVMGALNKSASKVTNAINNVAPKKKCQECGAELDWNATFCSKCGAKYVAPEIRKCQNCGTVIDDGDMYCSKCGAKYEKPVVIVCNNCGATNEKDALYCEKCGTKLIKEED